MIVQSVRYGTVITHVIFTQCDYISKGELQREHFNLEVAERIGRMPTPVTEENVTYVRKMLDEDRQDTNRQIDETIGLNVSTILSILKR